MKYEENKERKHRLEKIAAATIGIVAGGAVLKNNGSTKHIAKAFGDLSGTMSKVSKDIDLVGRKGLTAEGIGNIFKKHISNDDSTWKLARKNTVTSIDLRERGLIKDLLSIDKLSSKVDDIYNKRFDTAIREDIMESMSKRFKDIKNRDEDFMKDLYNFADRALRKQDTFFEQDVTPGQYNAMMDEFKDALKGTRLEGKEDQIADVLTEALNNSDDIRKRVDRVSSDTQQDIAAKFVESLKDKYKPKETSGDRAATVNEVWAALQEQKASVKNNGDTDSVIDFLGKRLEEDPSIGDLTVDPKTFRMSADNQFYSIEDMRKAKNSALEGLSETIPGKLFGVKNFIEEANAPSLEYFAKGSYDPGLAKLQGGKDLLKEEMIYIGDKFYKIKDTGLEHFKEADGRSFISGKAGSKFGLMDRIAGNSAEKIQSNKILNALDINTKSGEFLDEFKSFFTKFDPEKGKDWERNLVKRFTKYTPDGSSSDVDSFYKDAKAISRMYNQSTESISTQSVNKLKDVMSGKALNVLKAIESDDMLEAYNALGIDTINRDLSTLSRKIQNDPGLKNTMTRAASGAGGKRVIKYEEILKRELLKEALFQDISANKKHSVSGYAITLNKLEKANLSSKELTKAKDIMNWGIIQERAETFSKDIHRSKTKAEKVNSYLNISSMFNGKSSNAQEDAFLKEFKESVLKFGREHTSIFQKSEVNKNIRGGYERNQWMTVNKTINPLDIIKSINDNTKDTGDMLKEFGGQFVAGRKNIDKVSSMTMLPYHMLNRLATPLGSFGLDFSNASTGSTLELAKNFGLKRILPVAGVAFAASYLNYESQNFTGISATAALENAKAQFGVGLRTIASPFDNYLERTRDFNPLANYWLGDHKDKEEYLDYLEYGYDPVRKGRFWSFGSASEFRGGNISYWEPNKLRQAHSNYKDIAIYGSSEEKWKHSLIPTLRHPLSTLKYLSNPYWLEEKHYDDRPYPVSGKMFSEGTPWGAILNPTIGEIIKPQKRMHKEHLQGTMIDVRSIIADRNKEIKDRAQENRIIRFDESGVTPMMFSPYSMPTTSEAIYSVKVQNGQVTSAGFEGQDYAETMTPADQAVPATIASGPGMVGDSMLQHGVQRLNSSNTFENKMAASWLSGIASLAATGAIQGQQAVSMIQEINNDIKTRAQSAQRGEWFEKANMHTNQFRKDSYNKKLSFQEDMIEFNTKKDFVSDMIYSTKQLSGMYGFLFDQILPSSQGYKLEQAGKMSSFTRTFWDESMGGLGGNFMEIARRFFPHENHDITQLNPIKNTMEDWMPVRFQTGDPYTKVPKGEARLPGAGYEALNKLHSDKYGRYGAFDRYKILADIAPLSEEYKVWKKIAKSEVSDQRLKKEMTAIEERVKEQVKEHDFYNYKFLGKKMTEHSAVIEEVSNTGKFKVVGSDQEFTMAGIKVLKDEEGNSQIHNYLKAGMRVNLSYENNTYSNVDSTGRISAVVKKGTSNVNQEMFENKAATEKDTKETLADEVFNLTEFNVLSGHIWEAIGHAPIPFIHNKFMRIDSSLESYKKEQVYGTPYSTWDHPIKGFIKPSFQQAFAAGPVHQMLGVAAWGASEYFKNSDNKLIRTAADTAFALVNPGGAFAGGMIGALPKMSLKTTGGWDARNGARIGAAVGLAGYALTNTQNPLLTTANFAMLGMAAQEQFKFKGLSHGKGALIGAGVGLAISGLNPESRLWNLSKKYIPEDTEKKWEIEEYFDRLEYVKYEGLYHKAAKEAKRKEGVDVHRIMNQYERNKEKNAKLIEKLEEQKKKADKMIDEQAKNQLIASIDAKISDLLTPIQYLKAGEYTKSALAYKKAADTTIYGLSKDATTADVLRALPKYDRDFFLDFANVKDPKERKKILQYVSPYKAKALKIMWGEEFDEAESNSSFFGNHNLPNMFWSGWNSNVDLEHVKMKTIENEGMLLSDFGLYDSAKSEPAAMMAPEISNINSGTDPLSLQASMLSLLNGVGFQSVDVSVESSMTPGVQMVANIARVATYNISNSVSSTLGKLI